MVSFIVDEEHLRRLSPETRRELLQVLSADIADLKSDLAEEMWDPEGSKSYPLDEEEARVLIRGLTDPAKNLLRGLCRSYDGKVGEGELADMLKSTGCESYEELGHAVSVITQRLHSVTGNPDAWLLNWHAKDWEWDEDKGTYMRGRYFIAGPAIESLRAAFSIGEADG